MRTTIDIDPELLEEVVSETGETSRGRAVNSALAEFMRRRKIQRLITLAREGKIHFEGEWEDWHKRDMEMEEEEKEFDWGAGK